MKLTLKSLSITTAILLICLETNSVKASTPQLNTDLPSANLLAQMRRPGQNLNNPGAFRVPILVGQNFLSEHNVMMGQNFIVFRPKLRP